MNSIHCLLAIARADLIMRVRSPRFWVVLGVLVLLSCGFFPSSDQHYLTAAVNGNHRALYSSAWIGMLIALLVSTLLAPVGFYVIRGTLTRDIETRVWQLMVVTTMTRRTYLFAKWCSHLLTLLLMAGACLATGLVMQWIRAEDRNIDLIELIKPLLFISLPMLAMTAACAIWFDMLPPLRRTAGNILFFILWVASLSIGIADEAHWKGKAADTSFGSEPAGMVVFLRDLNRNVGPLLPEHSVEGFCLGCGEHDNKPVQTFTWQHWQPRLMDLPIRVFWLFAAMLAVAAAAPLLDWAAARAEVAEPNGKKPPRNRPLRWLTRLLAPLQHSLLGRMVSAEILLVMRQRRIMWWLFMFGFCLMQAIGEPQVAAIGVMLSWLMFLDVVAHAALRDKETGTSELVFTAPGATWRVIGARWLSLLALLWLFTVPGMLRFAAHAPDISLLILLVGSSVLTCGLALGALLRHARPFEALFCALAYYGIQGGAILNVVTNPQHVALLHACALPVAALIIFLRWPKLTLVFH